MFVELCKAVGLLLMISPLLFSQLAAALDNQIVSYTPFVCSFLVGGGILFYFW